MVISQFRIDFAKYSWPTLTICVVKEQNRALYGDTAVFPAMSMSSTKPTSSAKEKSGTVVGNELGDVKLQSMARAAVQQILSAKLQIQPATDETEAVFVEVM